MIVRHSETVGTTLLHFETGETLGIVRDLIIDPETGAVEALWVKSIAHPFRNLTLQTRDIAEWKKRIYLKDPDDIAEPGEVLRLARILEKKTYVIGNRVVNEEGQALGRAVDLDFDTMELMLRNIYVQKQFFWLGYQKRIIHSDNIIEMLPDHIKVRDIALKPAPDRVAPVETDVA